MKRKPKEKKHFTPVPRVKTYTVTSIKNLGTEDFIEIVHGLSDDLHYRTADSENFKCSFWNLKPEDPFHKRFFYDDRGNKHYSMEFEQIGDGDPYATVDLVIVQATMFDLENKVRETAKNYMFIGNPMQESYQAALEYWTEF